MAEKLPGEEANGDATGERGVVERAVLGEVGDDDEADIEERFLLPGTAFGAEELGPLLASLPLGLAVPEAPLGWEAAGAGGVAK